MARGGERRLRAVFPAGVWEADVSRRYPPESRGRNVADAARAEFEAEGVREEELLLCEPEGPDGTQLEDCLKIYLPLGARDPAERPFGMVFIDLGRERPGLVMLAFGVRHRPEGSARRRSIGERIAG